MSQNSGAPCTRPKNIFISYLLVYYAAAKLSEKEDAWTLEALSVSMFCESVRSIRPARICGPYEHWKGPATDQWAGLSAQSGV